LAAVKQPSFERIIQFDFSSKNSSYSLFFELFSKGNIILTHEGKILAVQEKQLWSVRNLSTKELYKLPPSTTDPTSLDEKQLTSLLNSTNKTDLVRFFAIELSLGKVYAEELCLLTGLDKKESPAQSITDTTKILHHLKKLLDTKLSPSIIYDDNTAIDAVPINLIYYKDNKKKSFKTYSEALQEVFPLTLKSPYENEISRLKAMIRQQHDTVSKAKIAADNNAKIGELIYTNHHELKELLKLIESTRKSSGWEAVKQLTKSNNILKSVDEKKGKITVDIQ